MSIQVHSRRWLAVKLATAVCGVTLIAAATADAAGAPARAADPLPSVHRDVVATTHGAPVLGGLTASGWPVVLVVAPNGKRVSAVISLELACRSGGSFAVPDGFFNLAIGHRGRIHAAYKVAPSGGSSVSITGGSRSITAHLDRKHWTATGVWHVHLNFATSSGQTDQCDSGNVYFSVRL